MIATKRRRGYESTDKYLEIDIIHPDAWMYKVDATTNLTMTFAYTWETNGNIDKVIIDDVTYEGDTLSQVTNGSSITFTQGKHTAYVYFKNDNVCGLYNDLGNDKLVPYELRTSRGNKDNSLSFYYPGKCVYYICCNTVMYPYNAQKGYYSSSNTHCYVPYDMQESFLNNSTWEERGMTKNNFIPVKYNFIEDPVDIIHPDMLYFEVTTTELNLRFNLFYAEEVTRYILDGVLMNSNFGYNDAFGYVEVPTPGFHLIYAGCNNGYNSRVLRCYGSGVLRPKRYTTQFLNAPSGLITKLILLQTTPPTWGGSGSIPNMCSNCTKILVPTEALDTYKTTSPWSSLASKIYGVNYDIVEDL